jgi:hypothetical protein
MKMIINNMKMFTNIIKNIIKKELPRPLGRWRIEDCNSKLNNKIDLSNEDHCGPCGKYALGKITLLNKPIEPKDVLSKDKK